MKKILLVALATAACSPMAVSDAELAPPPDMTRPMPRPDAASTPPAGARTVEAFDTTTAAQRAAATEKPAPASEARLGRTVATLGSPADPGFWLATPLVDQVRPGRVVAVAGGASVQVELRPIDAEPGAGSRISLPALRLLNVGLTGLHELDVFAL